MSDRVVSTSKFLSLVLRHQPEAIGLTLGAEGWAQVDDLLARMKAAGKEIDLALLETVVADNDKKRFVFSEDRTKIRANQGHSVSVDLGLQAVKPPDTLFHGTATRFLESIERTGLEPRGRQQVHLSATEETARTVGARHGRAVVLIVDARRMEADGIPFFLSENGVWLTDAVPLQYLSKATDAA